MSDEAWNGSKPAIGSRRGEPASVGSSAVKLFAGLGVVLLLAVGGAWVVKRLGLHRRVGLQSGGHLQVIDTVQLGVKRSVSLVALGDQVLVVGHGEQQVSHLCTVPRSVLDKAPEETAAATGPDAVSAFRDRLAQALKGGKA